MSVHGFREPNPIFEPECLIGQRTYRTSIDHVPRKVVGNCIFDIGAYFSMIAPVQHPVDSIFGDLISDISTAIAKDTTVHMELYRRPQVASFGRPALFFGACSHHAVLVGEVL